MRPVGERGSATVVLIAVLATTSIVTASLFGAASHRVAAARARGAADAAALAAAAATVGLVTDPPCVAAERLARVNAAVLVGCGVDGARARVEVSVGTGPLSAHAVAVAGPRP